MIKFIAIVVTIIIGLVGLITNQSFKVKLGLGILIVLCGSLSVYQAYKDYVTSTQREKVIDNLLMSSSPSARQVDTFSHALSSYLSKNGHSEFQFSNTPGRTTYDIKDVDQARSGFLLLTDDELLRAITSTDVDQCISAYFSIPTDTRNISDEWNTLVTELTPLVSALTTNIGASGIRNYLDSKIFNISFQPIDRNGNELAVDTLIFTKDELENLMLMSRVKRGMYIANKSEKVWSYSK